MKFDDDIPPPTSKREMLETYRFADMKPGQSFFVEANTKDADKIAAAAREWGKKQSPPRVFVAERRGQPSGDGANAWGVRIWRKT